MPETKLEQLRQRLSAVEAGTAHAKARDGSGGTVGALLFDVQRELCDVLATERIMSYALELGDGGVRGLRFCHRSHEAMRERTQAADWFGRYVVGTPNWARFNPMRPQRRQRNRVVVWTQAAVLESPAPTVREAYPVLGLDGRAQARALVCAGDSLLAFVGAWQPEAFRGEQLRTFRALLPLLRRRLELEALTDVGGAEDAGEPSRSLLEVALDAIARPVLVLGAGGKLREANRLAQRVLATRGEEIARGVKGVLRGQPPASWRVTRVEGSAGGVDYLVLLPVEQLGAMPVAIDALARAWELTARQSDVLALLCEGRSNLSIAAVLSISPRTVEVHVAALFDKARVSTRSALVAKALLPSA